MWAIFFRICFFVTAFGVLWPFLSMMTRVISTGGGVKWAGRRAIAAAARQIPMLMSTEASTAQRKRWPSASVKDGLSMGVLGSGSDGKMRDAHPARFVDALNDQAVRHGGVAV